MKIDTVLTSLRHNLGADRNILWRSVEADLRCLGATELQAHLICELEPHPFIDERGELITTSYWRFDVENILST